MRSRFETWLCLCVVFVGKTLHFHNTSFDSGVLMGGGKLSREARWNTGGVGAVTLWLDWHPIWGRGIVIFLLASCYGYPDKLWQDGPLGLGYRGTDLLLIQCWNFQSYKSLTTHLSKCLSTNGETSKSIKSWLVAYLVLMTNSSWKKTVVGIL